MKKLSLVLLAAVFTLSVYSCRETENEAEEVENEVENATEEVESDLEEAGQEIEGEIDEEEGI